MFLWTCYVVWKNNNNFFVVWSVCTTSVHKQVRKRRVCFSFLKVFKESNYTWGRTIDLSYVPLLCNFSLGNMAKCCFFDKGNCKLKKKKNAAWRNILQPIVTVIIKIKTPVLPSTGFTVKTVQNKFLGLQKVLSLFILTLWHYLGKYSVHYWTN